MLTGMGVDKIILVTHYRYANDLNLAGQLSGVDIVIGGDSHTLLGDFSQYGLNPAGEYPTITTDKDGKTVCVAQAWEYSHAVGELTVLFDKNGEVRRCGGYTHLLLGDTFKQDDADVGGNDLAVIQRIIADDPQLTTVTPDADAEQVLAIFSDQVDTLKQEVIGTATEDLCLEGIPGQGYSLLCDVGATLLHGADISNIVAKAFREMSLTSDIAIHNAGGVRIDIPAGDITLGDAYLLLPFTGTLLEIDMTGQQIVNVLEDAYDYAISPNGTSGSYPYASGLRWDLDGTQAKGSRFTNVQVMPKGDQGYSPINLTTTYKVVTNSYIAEGKDGYTAFGLLAEEQKVDTFLDYAQSFVDYVKSAGSISKLPTSEYSTQNYTPPL